MAQWIERDSPKIEVRVRFPVGALGNDGKPYGWCGVPTIQLSQVEVRAALAAWSRRLATWLNGEGTGLQLRFVPVQIRLWSPRRAQVARGVS